MGCRIIRDKDLNYEVFYCSTIMRAFGPIMYEDAEEFQQWLKQDPRNFSDEELDTKYSEFKKENPKDDK